MVLPALKAGTQLDLLVEAMGRVNFDKSIHDRKGITEKVELVNGKDIEALKNWAVYNFPVNYDFVADKNYQDMNSSAFCGIEKPRGCACLLPCYLYLGQGGGYFLQYGIVGKRYGMGKRSCDGTFLGNRSPTDTLYAGMLA